MTIFGRRLGEYIQFCKPFLILIPVVGIARLALSMGGASNATAKWVSMTGLVWLSVLYYSVRIHTSRFGSYKQLLVICALLNITAQSIAILGILMAIITGTGNIYSSPEYAFGTDGASWVHIGAHIVIGMPVASLIPWLLGSLVLFITKKVAGPDLSVKSTA